MTPRRAGGGAGAAFDGLPTAAFALDADAIPPRLLRAVERGVRPRDQRAGIDLAAPAARDADAGRGGHTDAVPAYRDAADLAAQGLGDAYRAVARRVGQDEQELVAAEAAPETAGPRDGAQPGADGGQDRIAAEVTVAVVHGLEVVEIEHHERHRPARAPAALQRRVEAAGACLAAHGDRPE